MAEVLDVQGVDVPIEQLRPLKKPRVNLKSNGGYKKIMATMKAIGLVEPLCVYPENGGYVILDGCLRYEACRALGVEVVPCLVYQDPEAYTFNRMVNKLSPYQEMRMLRRSLETIEESRVAQVFGVQSIRYRLAPKLVADLHPKVAKTFEEDLLSKIAAMELACVKPDRQIEILKEMKRAKDFSVSFVRALVLKTPVNRRNPDRTPRQSWIRDVDRKKQLVRRLEEAEKQHDFYTRLYREYSADLVKLSLYIRRIVSDPDLAAYLEQNHAEILRDFKEVVLDG